MGVQIKIAMSACILLASCIQNTILHYVWSKEVSSTCATCYTNPLDRRYGNVFHDFL